VIEALDTSVLILRERDPAARAWLAPRLHANTVSICDVVAMEYLMGARNGRDYDRIRDALDACIRVATHGSSRNGYPTSAISDARFDSANSR